MAGLNRIHQNLSTAPNFRRSRDEARVWKKKREKKEGKKKEKLRVTGSALMMAGPQAGPEGLCALTCLSKRCYSRRRCMRVVSFQALHCVQNAGDVIILYNDLDIYSTHLSSLASSNAVTTVPYRVVYITLLDASC